MRHATVAWLFTLERRLGAFISASIATLASRAAFAWIEGESLSWRAESVLSSPIGIASMSEASCEIICSKSDRSVSEPCTT